MAWKPKEKELTEKEAQELAKKKFEHLWHWSEPLLGTFTTQNGVEVFPLDSEFEKWTWMIFFVDPSDVSSVEVMDFMGDWLTRYHSHKVNSILFLASSYGFYEEAAAIDRLVGKLKMKCPIVTDSGGMFKKAFKIEQLPSFLFFFHGKYEVERSGERWWKGCEWEIQKNLRKHDPGLPLFPVRETSRYSLKNVQSIEFGESFADKDVVFSEETSAKNQDDEVLVAGPWERDSESIKTNDSRARLFFKARGNEVYVVANGSLDSPIATKVYVDLEGVAAFKEFCGSDLQFDDTGKTFFSVKAGGTFHVLTGLSENYRSVTIRVPDASITPVSLFGLRFFDL